jgi:hypothetical protein
MVVLVALATGGVFGSQAQAVEVAPTKPVLSEVSPDDAVRDWVEIHNPGPAPQDVGGWRLRVGNSSVVTLPSELVIPAGGWTVITAEPAGLGGHFVLPSRQGSLSLLASTDAGPDPATEPVDEVTWNAAEGASLVRCGPGSVLRGANRATPGRANDCSSYRVPDVEPGPATRPGATQRAGRVRVSVPAAQRRAVRGHQGTRINARVRITGTTRPGVFRVRIQSSGRVPARLNARADRLRIVVPTTARPGHRRVVVRYGGDSVNAARVFRFTIRIR